MTSSNMTEEGNFDSVRVICEVWLSMPIALAGIVGNILSLIVLCNHKQILSTTVVLQAVTVVDTLVLISTILLRSFRYVGISRYEDINRVLFPWMFPTTHAVRLLDTWLTVLLTVDRYIAVYHPLHAHHLCTIRRTCFIILGMVLIVAAFSVPRYFEYYAVDFSVSKTGFRHTALMENRWYAVGYCILAFFIVMYLVPMTILTVLNACILVSLRRSNAQRFSPLGCHKGGATSGTSSASGNQTPTRSGSSSSSSWMGTITRIAVTIVLICVSCNITAMAAHVLYSLQTAFEDSYGYMEVYRRHLANYSNVLVTLNSAVNFVVYCAFSRKFRNVFIRLCRRCCCCRR